MKKIFLIPIIISFAGLAFAQNFGIDVATPIEKLDVNGNANIRGNVYASGNVGIGTISPATKLSVVGNINLGTTSDDFGTGFYTIKAASGSSAINGGDGRELFIEAGVSDNSPAKRGGHLYLRPGQPTSPATSYGSVIIADQGGNVGIGITPTVKLEVDGTLRTTNFQMTSGAAANTVLVGDANGNGSWQTLPASGISGSGVATRVAFWNGTSSLSSNTNLFWDNTNNRLGIGEGNPASKLHVYDASDSRITVARAGSSGTHSVWRYNTGTMEFGTLGGDGLSIIASGMSRIFASSLSNGFVGIGTTAPASKLDVNEGALTLSGTTGSSHGILFDRGPVIGVSGGTQASISQEWNGIPPGFEALTFRADNYKFQNFDGTNEIFFGGGNLGVGTISPAAQLHTTGSVRFEGVGGSSETVAVMIDASGNLSKRTLNSIAFTGISGGGSFIENQNLADQAATFRINGNGIFNGGNVGIGTTSPGYYLQIGQQVAGNNANYSLGILRHGSSVTPGTYTAENPALVISDLSGDGPGAAESAGLLHIVTGRISDSDPNAGNANLISVQNDNGHAFVVKGNRNVGIGTNTPTAGFRLEVVGAARIGTTGGISILSLDANSANIRPSIGNGDILISDDSGSPARGLTVANGGSVGILTAIPAFSLEVNGSAGKPGGGSWSVSSDARLKKEVHPYSDGLDMLLSINPIRYHYNETSGHDTKPEYVGVIAQELQKVAPYMVGTFNKNGEEYLCVDNSAMVYMLINAMKEQHAQIEQLKKGNEALKKSADEVQELKAMVEELKAKLEGNIILSAKDE